MKQKMKHLVSFAALLLMMISMFSIWVLPAAAAEADDYTSLLNGALVVDPKWAGCKEGDAITFDFRGNTYNARFNSKFYFASYADAMARADELGLANPVILLCAGTYTETMDVTSAITLLGPNAGIDPNVKSASKSEAWTLSTERGAEAIIRADIFVKKTAGNGDLTIDGLRFEKGGAIVDYNRTSGSSTITVKNSVFQSSGNEDEARQFTMYLRSSGHQRTVELQNLYITGLNLTKSASYEIGFIAPFFADLKADNIAYINNKNGFIAQSWFAQGVSPLVEVSNSCFYNSSTGTAGGYVISMDNQSYDYNFTSSTDLLVAAATDRPAATLTLTGNVFYNATSNAKAGVIHFEFINARTVVDMRNNYFRMDDNNGNNGKSVLVPEFINAVSIDHSDCIVIRDNCLIGTYKVPSLANAGNSTYIDMSYNYFATAGGVVVYKPIYTDSQHLIRTDIWIDEEMTPGQGDWNLRINNWALSWVDDLNYSASIILYDEVDIANAPITFEAGAGRKVQLYTAATITSDGIITAVNPRHAIADNKLTESILGVEAGTVKTIYVQVTSDDNPDFAPVYTITIENMGTVANAQRFSDAYPGYFMYKPEVKGLDKGTLVPYLWNGGLYLFEAGVNAFSSVEEIINYADTLGIRCPTIVIPAGIYEDELIITGSCTILGEKHGINPNVKPYDVLTKENFNSSAWTLSPDRSEKGTNETQFVNAIRVAKGADNYTVTLDGIMMGNGCSYVDDEDRTGETVTIFKNVLAVNPGGGLNRNGAVGAVFNFNKAYTSTSTDRCHVYMYDTRIVGLDRQNCFEPYFEKLVLDGVYYGKAINQSHFFNGMCSRDVADPYYSITNSYFHACNATNMNSFYPFGTNDTFGTLAAKTNIVYNLDNNVFNEFFPKGYGAFQIYFTGNNMTFSFTNNTVYNSDSDTIFACTYGSTRFKGTCASENVSDMLIVKGNRLIGKNRLPMTNGTGVGTMFDFSGNYYSSSIANAALAPAAAWRTGAGLAGENGYTYEEATRVKIDYTFMDWDMTIRSDASSVSEAVFETTTGKYGTGVYSEELQPGGTVKYIYRDQVPAECTVYDNPVIPGEFSNVKLYADSALTKQINAMELTAATNTFYCVVASGDNKVKKMVELVIERALNSECELYYMSDFIIDDDAKTIAAYIDFSKVRTFYFNTVISEASVGARVAYYSDAACTRTTASARPSRGGTTYVKVTSEDNSDFVVYELNFFDISTIDVTTIDNAAITYVDGMTKGEGNTFETTITIADAALTFKPAAYYGGTCEVYDGNTKLTPDENGYYTVPNTGAAAQVLTAVATSGSGKNQATYSLIINKAKSNACELLSIEGAQKTSSGFVWSLGLADAAVLKGTVSAGATYEVYEEYACKNRYANNLVLAQKGTELRDSFSVYVKVTANDGVTSKVFKVTALTQAGNRTVPIVKGVVDGRTYTALMTGKNEYTLYLPAGVKNVTLSGAVTAVNDEGKTVNVSASDFFADKGRTVMIGDGKAVLDQKVTTLYMSTPRGQFTKVVDDQTYYTVVPASKTTLKIVSDRSSVQYSDADKVNNHWVKSWVNYLNDNKYGIFMGDENGKINVENKITRYEIATVAARVLGLDVGKFAGVNSVVFVDSIAEWAQPYVKAVAVNGIMNGHLEGAGLIFDGNAYATREEVFKVLVAVCIANDSVTVDGATYYANNKATVDAAYNTYTFADESKISDWAVPYIRLAVGKYELVGGSLESDGKLYLNPAKDITRAEVAKMIAVYYGY